MAEPTKQQIGDGNDNVGGAVNQGAKAAKQLGKNIASKAAQTGAQTTVNAANLVKAGAKGGKVIAEIASGTAAGGPWGAIIAAAWSMRHTLFKILVCVCLIVLFIIVTVVAIPGILLDNIINVFVPDAEEPAYSVVQESYIDLASVVTSAVDRGHSSATSKIEQAIADGGYDYSLSMQNITDLSSGMTEHDICYVLSAYSVAGLGEDISRENLIYRLNNIVDRMFPVTYEARQIERTITVDDKPTTVTVNYLASTVHAFDEAVIYEAFGLDPNAVFPDTGKSNREMIEFYTQAFENILNLGG